MDSGSQEKKSIPKFASFKPPPAPPQADRSSEHRETARRHERSRHRSRHHRERSRSREHRRERREHRYSRRDVSTRKEIALEPLPPPKAVNEPEDDGSDLFIVDLKGDRHNLIYGTIHRYNIPRYHRVGRGNVLGLPRSYKIDRETSEGDALVIRTNIGRTDATKTKSKSALLALRKRRTKLLTVQEPPSSDFSKNFLPFPTSSKQKRRTSLGHDSEDEKYAYRSIHGKAKPDDDLSSDAEYVSDTDSDEEFRVDLDEEVKQANVELSRNVERSPSDVDAWLRLINHQDSLLGGGKESRSLTYAEKQSLADIKISLYEKALKRVGQIASRDRLLLGLLEEGAKLWDTKKLSAQWQSILKANSHFISLWVRYLDFRQTQFLDFTYERCLETFVDCLRLNMSSPQGPHRAQVQSYLFLRLTLFIREAGFAEHAVGVWQAIFEWTFFRPEADGYENMLSSFRDFWESEVARIGENGAKGWKSGNSSPIEPKSFTPASRLNPKSMFASWMECERERIINARLPARSLDESEDDDPYRVIIPSDYERFISLFQGFESGSVLIDSFLHFCHLPPLASPSNMDTTNRLVGDSFLHNAFMSSSDTTLDDWLSAERTDEHSPLSPMSFPSHNFIHTLDTFFADPQSWFSSFAPWAKATFSGRSEIEPDWTRRTLQLLVEANPSEELAEYTLAVEFACNPKEAKKYAKSLLKKRSSSLRLYNAYALMESRSGNQKAADHVWATFLSMSKTFADSDKVDCGLLWRTWIWEAMELRDIGRACHLLRSIPQQSIDPQSFSGASDQVSFSPSDLLRIQSVLSDGQEQVLHARKPAVFVAYTDCLALLTYLANSLDLTKPLETYTAAMTKLQTLPTQDSTFTPFTLELLHQSRSIFLYHHIQTSTLYKPSQIRSLLTESISLFPHNTIFLSLFAWNESRFRIEERVRDVIRDITHSQTNYNQKVPVTSHLFSIYTELTRPLFAGSTPHSIRAAFEKAIGDPTLSSQNTRTNSSISTRQTTSDGTAHSNLTVWKLYILFELSRNDITRAKNVFYRGMRACPWSKELIMLAFTHLRADQTRTEGMDFEELRRVYNVLVEKELRIHVDIEENLDEMAEGMKVGTNAMGIQIRMPVDADSEEE